MMRWCRGGNIEIDGDDTGDSDVDGDGDQMVE